MNWPSSSWGRRDGLQHLVVARATESQTFSCSSASIHSFDWSGIVKLIATRYLVLKWIYILLSASSCRHENCHCTIDLKCSVDGGEQVFVMSGFMLPTV